METSSTYPKFSFLRFFYTLVLVPLLLVSPGLAGEVMGQEKVLADSYTAETGSRPLLAGSGPIVLNPANVLTDDDDYAVIRANPGLIAGLSSYQGYIEFEFSSTRPADTWSYIRIGGDSNLFDALLGGSLGNALGDVLGAVLLGNQEIEIQARDGGTPILTRNSTQGFDTDRARLLIDSEGQNILAIRPANSYDRIRIINRSAALAGLNAEYTLNVYNAFYFEDNAGDCGHPMFTSFDGTGIGLTALALQEQNLGNAIDDDLDSYSVLKQSSLLDVNVGGSLSQYFYLPTVSPVTSTFNVKLSLAPASGILNGDLLDGVELIAWDGSEAVYRRSLAGGLLNGVDILGLLGSGSPATLTFAPGREFDRIEVRLNSPIGVSLAGSSIHIYDVERFDEVTCNNPLVTNPTATEGPFDVPNCDATLEDFENVDFAQNAVDGNNETFATLFANNGSLLGSPAADGMIEMELPETLPAFKTSYVRINFDEEVLDRLVGGSLGKLVADIGGLALGNHFFEVEARNDTTTVLERSSSDAFENPSSDDDGVITLVQDNIGRYYLAITPSSPYNRVRITNRVSSLLPTGETRTMDVYNLCYETGLDRCFPANFTSYEGGGLNLGVAIGNEAGVTNPYRAISSNSSEYSEISLGTAGVVASVFQTIYFTQPSEVGDMVRVRLQTEPSSALSLDVIGQYRVEFYNGSELVDSYTMQQGLINNIDLLALFNSGGIFNLEYVPTGVFDRVKIGIQSTVALGVATPPMRLYNVKRISEDCPEIETPSPFDSPVCAGLLIAAENADDIDNLFDTDFDSFATLNSGAGTLLGLGGQFEGFVELGYDHTVPAGTTSYIRIDFDEDILTGLLGGSLGNVVTGLLNGLALGDHFFEVEVKNNTYDGDGQVITSTVVDEAISNDASAGGNNSIRIVRDKDGRFYIAVTPTGDYNAVRITDHTNSALGLLTQPNTMNVYGMCYEASLDQCLAPFATSYEFSGLGLTVNDLSGAGVTNPHYAINDNSTQASEISMGTLNITGGAKQWIFFNTTSVADDVVEITFRTGAGGVDLDLLGDLEIKAYLGETEVATLDWQNGIINGINVINLINNGETITVPFAPGQEFDRISVGISSVLNASVFPPVQLYSVERCATLADAAYVTWKSFEIDGDLALTSVEGGETVEYTIHLRNTGPVDLTDFIITDEIPDNTNLVPSSISDGGMEAGGVITWEDINVPVGGTATVSFSVTVDEDLTGLTEISNVALVQAYETDPGTGTVPPADNDDPSAGPDPTATPGTPTDILVDHTNTVTTWKGYAIADGASTTSVSGGETITYTIYIENTSNQDLEGLIVEDDIPLGTMYESGGTSDGTTVTFTGIDVDFGETVSVSFVVVVNDDLSTVTEISNVALVKTDGTDPGTGTVPPNDPSDPSAGPDPGATPGTPTVIPVDPIHSIEFNKIGLSNNAESDGKAEIGDEITYTLTVKNTGNKALTDIVVTDNLPADVTINDNGGGTEGTGTLTFNIPTLAVGATDTFTFVVVVDDLTVGDDIVNTAEAAFTDANGDPDAETAEHRMPTDCTTIDADNLDLSASVDEICEGEIVTLTATIVGATITDPEIRWYTDPGLAGSYVTGNSIDVSPDVTTTYHVTIVADAFCFGTPAATIEVTVNPVPPTPSIAPNGPIEICDGDVATLTATSAGATSYIWYLDGVEISGETANTLGATESGIYTVVAVNADGCASAESVPVIVAVTPRATTSDLDVTGNGGPVCEGTSVSLTASSATLTNPVFNWYSDAALTELIFTGATLTINPAADITLYVTVQGDGVCETAPVDAEVVAIVVNPAPDFTVDGSLNYSIEVGNSVALPTIVAPSATVTWHDNDGDVHGDPTVTETFDTPGTYTYTAVISEDDHCTVTVSVIINVFAEGECPPTYDRIYATEEIDSGESLIGTVQSTELAVDSDVASYSILTEGVNLLGLLGQTFQTVGWDHEVNAGTPVSVKLGKAFTTAEVIGGLRVVAVNAAGNPVSTVQNVDPSLAAALGGLNVFEYTFTPVNSNGDLVAYNGIKIYYQAGVSLLQTARLYETYYHEVGTVDCGDTNGIHDVITGVENAISGLTLLTGLVEVEDEWNAVDGDEETHATLRNLAGVNAYTRMEVLYGTPALAGDVVDILVETPGTLLSLGLLESFRIQPYLGNAAVGEPITESSSLLTISLLSGDTQARIRYEADAPFDRIKILYGAVADVLDGLRILEITRNVPQLELGDNGDNVFEICEGEDIVIPEPDDCTTYVIYDAATGGTVVDITELGPGTHILYVQTVRFGTCEVGTPTEITVTVNALPVAPVVANQEICQEPVDTDVSYDVTALPDHTLNYYESETATTPLADIPVVNSAVAGVYTVYVSQFNDNTGCEGPRVAVSIEVIEVPAPTLTNLEQVFCEIDMPTVADLNTDGADGDLVWYTAATGGTPLAADVALTTGTYYAAQIGDNCESVDRTAVEVTITETPAPTLTELEQVFCEIDMPTVADLNTDGADGDLVWYTAATGGTPLAADVALITGTYYAAQVGDNCESVDRTAVEVTITETPAPNLTNLEQTFCEIDMPTVADLNMDGATGDVVWYTAATGGTALADDAALTAGTYYAAQIGDNCESVDRTEVTVIITETPAPNLTNLEQTFCEIDGATVADLNTDGATGDVVWYTAATGGTPLVDTDALTAGTYYAAQIGDNCESVDRTEVTVIITETPAPTLTELEQTFCEIDMPTVADLNTDGATGDVVWYTAATGGTALADDAALTTSTYYAAQIGDNCESVDRTEVTVTITETPAPNLTNLEQTFCEIDMATVADLNTDGATGDVVWYTAATGGTPLADTDALTAGTYYAAQIGDNCESVDRTAVEVIITETPAPTLTELEQMFCEIDMPTVADLNTDGATGDVVWYTAATGGTPLAADAALTAGTYYAAQIGDNCESVDRTAVEVTITETPAPTLTNLEYELCESDGLTVADLSTDGATGTVVWYTSATGGTALAADVVLTTGTYYAAQMGDNCESVDRTAVTVAVSDCTSLLSITKTADTDRATAGESISFTLTITNEGPGVMHSGDIIKLGERPSDGLTITGYEVTSGNGTAEGNANAATVTTTEDIAVGGMITLTVTADVDVDAPETVSNGIDVWGPDKDPETDPKDDDADTPPIPVDRESNMSITKEADEARVKAGESTSFTLTITNDGPSVIEVGEDISLIERPGDGVTITGYEVISGAATIAGDGNTAILTTTGKIAVGGTIEVKVTADVSANAGETITNGIDVWGPDKDPETDPKDDEDDTPPIPVDQDVALSITKVADEERVQAGGSTSFTLTITNDGPAVIASGKVISLTERPGAGVTITGYEVTSGNGTANGSGNNATVTTSSAIAVGGTIVVKVTADIAANAGETITNGIDVWGPDKDPETDPKDDGDDTPPIPVDHVSALSITKVANDQRVIAGGTTSFTVTVTNNGPATIAAGETIAVEERPGNGITITGYEVTSGNATVNGAGNDRQLTTTAAIAVGGTITFTVSADVTAPAGSTIANGVAVWGPDKNPGTDEEDDEDETPEIPVDRPYTLGIEKVADQSLVTAGESTTFTVTVTNNGPLDIEAGEDIALRERPGTGVTITGYEIISGAATVSGSGNTATLTTTGVVGVGATISVRITADVAETATGTITNGISVWGPDSDPDTDEPDDEDDTNPIPVDATLHIPNVFTPNGDGLNDRFVIKNLLQYQGRELIVVNRWGNQVFKSDNYNNDWDGGSLAEGTYYYILRYRNGGDWKTAKGPVAIIRVTNR